MTSDAEIRRNGMNLAPAGARVQLMFDVDRYPHFVAPEGAMGTVVDPAESGFDMFAVKLDERVPGAETWDNEVLWSLRDGDDPSRVVAMICADCGRDQIPMHSSGRCDSCETQSHYDRAAEAAAVASLYGNDGDAEAIMAGVVDPNEADLGQRMAAGGVSVGEFVEAARGRVHWDLDREDASVVIDVLTILAEIDAGENVDVATLERIRESLRASL